MNNNPNFANNNITNDSDKKDIKPISSVENKVSNNIEEKSEFSPFLSALKRRWIVFVTMTLGVTAGVAYWTYQLPPIYQGKFLLLVEKPVPQSSPSTNNNNNNNDSLQGVISPTPNDSIDYNTEIEILGSTSVLAPILKDVAVKYPDILEDINLPNLDNLNIQQIKDTKVIEVTFKDQDPQKIEFVLEKIAENYLAKNSEDSKNNLDSGLKFVRFQVPKLEQQVSKLQTQIQNLRQEHNFIDPQVKANELAQQIATVQQDYLSAQIQLQQAHTGYKNLQQQLNLTPQQAVAVNELSESQKYQSLLKELQTLEIEIATKSAVFTDENPQMISLYEKRDNLTKLLEAEKQNILKENNNNQASLNMVSPNQIRAKFTEEMLLKENEIKMLETKIDSLKTILEELNKQTQELPSLTRKYMELQRDLQTNTDSLKRFLETKEILELQKAQNTLNWRVISPPAVKKEPIYPLPLYNLIIGLISGLILGTITAMIVDRLDGIIHSLAQLKELTRYPILGQIPIHKNLNSVEDVIQKALPSLNTESTISWMPKTPQPQEYSSSYWIESFRNFYTNVELLGSDLIVNSLVISSANPLEGKSTIALNLAQTAAAMGKKVLLIDADLRLPQLHRLIGIDNEKGLSHVLATGYPLDSAIKEVSQWENLSVITAGEIPPDPTRLLYSQKMREIIQELKQSPRFDLIIYDSPSLLGFSDAKIIAPYTDGLVLVVKLDKTERNSLRQVTEQLKIGHISLLGIVANGIKYNDQNGYYRSQYHNHYIVSNRIKNSDENRQQVTPP